jgi:mannose-6-phosphate isomerase-like protein (cupin superfamily)
METIDIDDVEAVPHFMGANSHRKPLARTVEGMGFACTYLELDPGESFSGGLHTHTDQEELLVVLEGTATFETAAGPGAERETVAVGPHEAVHFEADGPFQQGRNETDGAVRGFALGVPGSRHGWAETKALLDCPECDEERVFEFEADDGDERMPDPADVTMTCSGCGHEL